MFKQVLIIKSMLSDHCRVLTLYKPSDSKVDVQLLVYLLFYDLCVSFFKYQQFLKSFVSFYKYGTKIIDLIFNYFLAFSLERPHYFILSEHCTILQNILVHATNY